MIGQELLLLKENGKVIIGDTSVISTPGEYGLYVEHGILTERVKVALKSSSEWADDAWDKRPDLSTVKKSIENNNHLYAMPGVGELLKDGYELKEMDAKLLAQIEWLWTYTIELKKENEQLKERLEKIEALLELSNK